MLWKSGSDFVKIGVGFWQSRSMVLEKTGVMILNRYNFTKYDIINFATYITLYNTYYFSIYLGLHYISLRGYEKMVWDRTAFILWQGGMRQDCIHFYDKMARDRTAFIFMARLYDRTASIFMTRWHETGLHSFLWQDCLRQDCIRFYDKMAWDRTASIFMARLYDMRQDCIHFYDKIAWDRHSWIFMTSHHKTGTHPFLWQASIRPVLIHFSDKPA